MAQFRMLADHYINGQILSVGSIQFTADVPGGLLPASWVPTGDSEPLDSAALTLFYSAGPQFPGVIRAQRADDIYAVKLPATYWRQIPGSTAYQLTGLGAGLPPVAT